MEKNQSREGENPQDKVARCCYEEKTRRRRVKSLQLRCDGDNSRPHHESKINRWQVPNQIGARNPKNSLSSLKPPSPEPSARKESTNSMA